MGAVQLDKQETAEGMSVLFDSLNVGESIELLPAGYPAKATRHQMCIAWIAAAK